MSFTGFSGPCSGQLVEGAALEKKPSRCSRSFCTEEGRGCAVKSLTEDTISNVGGTNKDLDTIHSENEARDTATKDKFMAGK